jgi:alginate O-acetyltransferase complex protein AlgI
MPFVSARYWLFLTVVFFVYWSIAKRRRLSTSFLLIASYYFYALWNPTFVPLLFALSTIDFFTAQAIAKTSNQKLRKLFLFTSITTDVGTLIIFKYFNFFSTSATTLLGQFHPETRPFLIEGLVIPLGLSFITFRSLSYVIDVYRKTLAPTKNYPEYLAFVAFFPTLIAGPVTRAKELLPQFQTREFSSEQGLDGIFLILLGLVKKVAIADLLGANLVDRVFDQPQLYSSVETLAAIYAYALQIYCDFSGYSDIAIGSALLLGFKLPQNFNSPYRAHNLRDFWKRWHISLSNWLFDYVYISIGGLRKRRFNLYRNLVITFLIGGLWHGAAWTFVVWGGLHGLGLAATHWWHARHRTTTKRRWVKVACTIATFHFVCLTWIVFRAEDLSQVFAVLQRLALFQFSTGNLPPQLLLILAGAFVAHWLPAKGLTTIQTGWRWLPSPAQAVVVLSIAFGLIYLSGSEVQFIYGNF